ncbi:MAG: hypothetical protein ACKO0M_10380 [Cyanobium sp.]
MSVRRNCFEFRLLDPPVTHVARSSGGFSSTRLLIGAFSEAVRTFDQGIRDLQASASVRLKGSDLLLYPLELVEGGLSEVEDRVLRDLVLGIGPRRVVIWQGPELGDEEVREALLQGR